MQVLTKMDKDLASPLSDNAAGDDSFADAIPVVFACDENYAVYLPAVIASLADNASSARHYEIIIMDCSRDSHVHIFSEIIDALRKQLSSKPNFCLRIIRVRESLEKMGFMPKDDFRLQRWGYATYARLLIPELLSAYEKALYLDIDKVILHDIAELFAHPMGDNWVAALPDFSVSYSRLLDNSERKKQIENILKLSDFDCYVVASPLLLNLVKCREHKFSEKVCAFLSREQNCPFGDQDAINAVCKGHIAYLPQKWGLMNMGGYVMECEKRKAEIDLRGKDELAKSFDSIASDWTEASKDPYIIHYSSSVKPWGDIDIYLGHFGWDYAVKTAFSAQYNYLY